MVKYRCVKSDRGTNYAYWEGRTYIEEGIANARKRAMKMIHGSKNDSVLIWLNSDFKEKPWIGYTEKVVLHEKNQYATHTKNKYVVLKKDGTPDPNYTDGFRVVKGRK